jgi:hypothetical protein
MLTTNDMRVLRLMRTREIGWTENDLRWQMRWSGGGPDAALRRLPSLLERGLIRSEVGVAAATFFFVTPTGHRAFRDAS